MCQCTEAQPCQTEDGPCHWETPCAPDYCSACVVYLEEQRLLVAKMCKYCDLVEMDTFSYGKEIFSCSKGRFDGGTGFPRWYVWSGITRPTKRVAEAQKHCPFFEVHRKYKEGVTR